MDDFEVARPMPGAPPVTMKSDSSGEGWTMAAAVPLRTSTGRIITVTRITRRCFAASSG